MPAVHFKVMHRDVQLFGRAAAAGERKMLAGTERYLPLGSDDLVGIGFEKRCRD